MMKKTETEAGSTRHASAKVLRRLTGVAVVLMMICLVMAMPVGATGTPDTSWYWNHENLDTYTIYTADELAGLTYLSTYFEGKTILLGSDIDLSGYSDWTPIDRFNGHFNGNGYNITNLSINTPSYSPVGLFGRISSSSEIFNVKLSNISIVGESIVGGIVGEVYSNCSIRNCSVEFGTISSTSGCIGGISSWSHQNNSIVNCSVKNLTIISGGSSIGGISGLINGEGKITGCITENCVITGEGEIGGISGVILGTGHIDNSSVITSSISGIDWVGGIIGHGSTVDNCTVEQCTITGNSDIYYYSSVGGISGRLYSNNSISNCYVSANITGFPAHVGGITGYASKNSTILNCYTVGNITGSDSVGGIAGIVYSPGLVKNCIALLYSINSNVNDADRIASSSSSLTTNVENNYAWQIITDSGDIFTDFVDVNSRNGKSVETEEFWNNQAFFADTLGWDFENTWTMNSGNDKYQLPVLQFQKKPVLDDASYLVSTELSEPLYPFEGDGTEDDPYQIWTAEDLRELSALVNGDEDGYQDSYYLLMDNINLNQEVWTPIGNSSYFCSFLGVFDGGGHIVSGLNISLESSSNNVFGLFGYNNGKIVNTTVHGTINVSGDPKGRYIYVGTVVGYNYGIVENVTTDSIIIATYPQGVIAGGIVGFNSGSIENGQAIVSINGNSTAVEGSYDFSMGGIAGYNSAIVKNCTTASNITAMSDYLGVCIGGLIGKNSDGLICNSTVYGTLSGIGYSPAIGGVVGLQSSGSLMNSYFEGNITGESIGIDGGVAAGGIVGNSGGLVENCSAVTLIFVNSTSSGYSGGIAGRSSDSIFNCHSDCVIISKAVTELNCGGIVGDSYGSTIDQCTVSGVIKGNYANFVRSGGIVGFCTNDISNCSFSGSVLSNSTMACTYSAGIAGCLYGNISNCSSSGSVNNYVTDASYESPSGGIVGYIDGNVTNCSSSSSVLANGLTGIVAGGIVGDSYSYYNQLYISNCNFTGSVIVYCHNGTYVGGIAGTGANISCSISTGSVMGTSHTYLFVGGVAGSCRNISQCFSSGSVSGTKLSGIEDDTIAYVIHVGGIVGGGGNTDNCYSTTSVFGSITGNHRLYLGGVAGSSTGNVTNCYSTGSIRCDSVEKDIYIGGCVGFSDGVLKESTINNCYALNKNITNVGHTSRIIGYITGTLGTNYGWDNLSFLDGEENGLSLSSSNVWNQPFDNWDFENTWKMNAGNDKYQLPVLQFQTTPVAGDASYLRGEEAEPTPTPTPEKPAAPTLTPSESLPDDAEVTTNTVAETSAATKAEVGYQVSPTDIAEIKAPTITRGSLSVMLNDKVKVTKMLADGTEEEVEAEVLEDGSVRITGSLDDAESVTVNFIGRQFGDVTNDGKPDTLDAARVLQASVGLYSFSDADTFYGDVSGDGYANTLDAARILQYSVNLVDENYVTKA